MPLDVFFLAQGRYISLRRRVGSVKVSVRPRRAALPGQVVFGRRV